MADQEDEQVAFLRSTQPMMPTTLMAVIIDNWEEFSAIYKNADPAVQQNYRQEFTKIDDEFAHALIGDGNNVEADKDQAE